MRFTTNVLAAALALAALGVCGAARLDVRADVVVANVRWDCIRIAINSLTHIGLPYACRGPDKPTKMASHTHASRSRPPARSHTTCPAVAHPGGL